ncbi:hypothetical protein KKF84_06450 [Myxococcota bacterium]|nr:hypothetical protein [Myxococcota bacterium]MBU1534940.1 hypothetical protein [Myxococcota bacterium]
MTDRFLGSHMDEQGRFTRIADRMVLHGDYLSASSRRDIIVKRLWGALKQLDRRRAMLCAPWLTSPAPLSTTSFIRTTRLLVDLLWYLK